MQIGDWYIQPAPRQGRIFSVILKVLLVTLLFFGMGGGIFMIIRTAFTSSAVYQEAMERARSNPMVTEQLGTPIQAGVVILGTLETSGITGEADLRVPIHGPRGRGTLFIQARRESGAWHYYTLAVVIHDKMIDLR